MFFKKTSFIVALSLGLTDGSHGATCPYKQSAAALAARANQLARQLNAMSNICTPSGIVLARQLISLQRQHAELSSLAKRNRACVVTNDGSSEASVDANQKTLDSCLANADRKVLEPPQQPAQAQKSPVAPRGDGSCSDVTGAGNNAPRRTDCATARQALQNAQNMKKNNPQAAANQYRKAAEAYRLVGDTKAMEEALKEVAKLEKTSSTSTQRPNLGSDPSPGEINDAKQCIAITIADKRRFNSAYKATNSCPFGVFAVYKSQENYPKKIVAEYLQLAAAPASSDLIYSYFSFKPVVVWACAAKAPHCSRNAASEVKTRLNSQ